MKEVAYLVKKFGINGSNLPVRWFMDGGIYSQNLNEGTFVFFIIISYYFFIIYIYIYSNGIIL